MTIAQQILDFEAAERNAIAVEGAIIFTFSDASEIYFNGKERIVIENKCGVAALMDAILAAGE